MHPRLNGHFWNKNSSVNFLVKTAKFVIKRGIKTMQRSPKSMAVVAAF